MFSPKCAADTPLQRTNDAFLIKRFSEVGYKGMQLQILNRVRLSFQIYSLADIVMAGGRMILDKAAVGEGTSCDGPSPFTLWPHGSLLLTQCYSGNFFPNSYSP